MIKALVFDLGNVLINFDWKIAESRLNQIQSELGTSITKFLYENDSIIENLEKGKITEDEFLTTIKLKFQPSLDKETIAKIFSEIFWENKQLTKLLPELKKNYKLYLLSNTNIIHRKFGWEHYEFLKHFDKLFLSYEIGAVKPEIEIYNFVINSTQLSPDEVLYIDDIEEYVSAAKNLGWNALHFRSNEELFEDLRRMKIRLDFTN